MVMAVAYEGIDATEKAGPFFCAARGNRCSRSGLGWNTKSDDYCVAVGGRGGVAWALSGRQLDPDFPVCRCLRGSSERCLYVALSLQFP